MPCPSRARDRERVDADHDTGAIDQRPAAVAGVDRRVGLNQPDGADVADRADDAARHGVREHAQRGADGDDLLPDACGRRRSEAQDWLLRVGVVDLQQREIAALRNGHHTCGVRGLADLQRTDVCPSITCAFVST